MVCVGTQWISQKKALAAIESDLDEILEEIVEEIRDLEGRIDQIYLAMASRSISEYDENHEA